MYEVRRRALALAAVGISLLFSFWWRTGVGLALNLSPSMPPGLYFTWPAGNPQTGDWVSLCIAPAVAPLYRSRQYLPDRDGCSSGLAPVLKPIVAVPGDVVSLEGEGVRVNGRLIPNSLALDTDSNGLPMPHLPLGWFRHLDDGEYFVLATFHPRSLDSRYYGPVLWSQILSKVFPLFVTRAL